MEGAWKKSVIREYVGDESQCRVCGTEFHTRDRLLKHLSERRLRSKHRTETCAEIWVRDHAKRVAPKELEALEAEVSLARKRARREGHRHVPALQPAASSRPSILRGRKRRPQAEPILPLVVEQT